MRGSGFCVRGGVGSLARNCLRPALKYVQPKEGHQGHTTFAPSSMSDEKCDNDSLPEFTTNMQGRPSHGYVNLGVVKPS